MPKNATFTITGNTTVYTITAAAVISGGLAVVAIDPPLAATAALNALILNTNSLVTDADLSAYESRMPELGKRVVQGGTRTAYDGKREMAKQEVGERLNAQGYALAGVVDPRQLRRAAVFLELGLIYQDLATLNEEIAADKAAYYMKRYEGELASLAITYEEPADGVTPPGRLIVNWYRA